MARRKDAATTCNCGAPVKAGWKARKHYTTSWHLSALGDEPWRHTGTDYSPKCLACMRRLEERYRG